MEPAGISVSAIVMTYNEEKNILQCLQSITDWVPDIIIVDSYSTDRTEQYARNFTSRIYHHEYVSAPAQWAWALKNVPIKYDWLLMLDADFRITTRLRESIVNAARSNDPTVNAYMLPRLQIFRGTPLRHGGLYPRWEVRMVRHKLAQVDEMQGVDHHVYCPGAARRLSGDLIEENRNEDYILYWLNKHIAYAERQARQESQRSLAAGIPGKSRSLFGDRQQRKLLMKDIWYRLPLHLRPFLYFGYRYFIRMGFLDGKNGFIFHFFQALWFRLTVDVCLEEIRSRPQYSSEEKM